MPVSNVSEVRSLAAQLDRSFHGGAWHGPAAREALTGIDAVTANRRPSGSPHTVVELVRHITFWLEAVYLRITGEGDVDPQADWAEQGMLSDEAWTQAIAELEQVHVRLHAALLDFEDERLDDAVSTSDTTVRGLLLGILQHNAYHTGQIVQIARELAS